MDHVLQESKIASSMHPRISDWRCASNAKMGTVWSITCAWGTRFWVVWRNASSTTVEDVIHHSIQKMVIVRLITVFLTMIMAVLRASVDFISLMRASALRWLPDVLGIRGGIVLIASLILSCLLGLVRLRDAWKCQETSAASAKKDTKKRMEAASWKTANFGREKFVQHAMKTITQWTDNA